MPYFPLVSHYPLGSDADEGEIPSSPPSPLSFLTGRRASRAGPRIMRTAALRRVGPAPHLGSRVEMVLVEGVDGELALRA